MPSTHEPATVVELLLNGDIFRKLSPDLQEIVKLSTIEATFRSQMVANRLNGEALTELREKHGVKIERTPDDILRKTLEVWDQIAKDESEKNPFFKKVYESQRAYAAKVVPTRRAVIPPYATGADYYWPENK
jgi:TRAP-type mannitol/chloroaromatic compound transport system substrate-binding protein